MSAVPRESVRCQFLYRDGRRCRLFRVHDATIYCYRHEDDLRKREQFRERAAEIVQPTDKLHRARDINRVLARIFREVAAGRMPAEDAARLAYMGQMLLNSLPFIERERERLAASKAKKDTTITEGLATSLGFGMLQMMNSSAAETKQHGEAAIQDAVRGLEQMIEPRAQQETPAAGEPQNPAPATAPHPAPHQTDRRSQQNEE